jgi:hypothetical protein
MVGDFVLNCPLGELDVEVAIFGQFSPSLAAAHLLPFRIEDRSFYITTRSFAGECVCSFLRLMRERYRDGQRVSCSYGVIIVASGHRLVSFNTRVSNGIRYLMFLLQLS